MPKRPAAQPESAESTSPVAGDDVVATTPPTAPFASVPAQLRAALERKGFASLTAVQRSVLDWLAETDGKGRDLQITSQTGSGKTVAIGFALTPGLVDETKDRAGPVALLLAPTRELAMQIRDELEWLFADLRHVVVDCVTGGTSQQLERQRLQRRPMVLVGTPGRLLDHATSGALSLASVRHVVLDEADQMLDMGFRDELEAILQKAPEERHTHLVSATFPPEVKKLTKRYQQDPVHVEGTALGAANADIEHVAHVLNARDRYAALTNLLLLTEDRRVLAFVRTREDTTRLADQLETDGFRAMPLSGDLTQAQRTRTLAAFKRGTVQVLVATDVAARGLDVPDVQYVVHMDPPIDAETYTHRSGRTGRAGQKGTSVLLVPRAQERGVRRLCSEAKAKMQWRPVPTAQEVAAARDEQRFARLSAACQQAAAEGHEAAAHPAKGQAALAERLLAAHDPATVVGVLLALNDGGGRPAPAAIASFVPPPQAPPPRKARPLDDAPHGDRRSDGGEFDGGGPQGEFVAFRINWGFADGADPRRILAHVCRRGGVPSNCVGAIDVGRTESVFEVAAAVAGTFAQQTSRRDPRDPHLYIHRAHGPIERGGGDRGRGPRHSRPPFAGRPPRHDRPRGFAPHHKRRG